MSYLDGLETFVRRILSDPDTDLTTISAKRVRRELLALDPSLTPEFVKENKSEIDAIITRVFGDVSAVRNNQSSEGAEEMISRDPNYSDQEEVGDDEEEQTQIEDDQEEKKIAPKKVKKGSKKQMSDAELARQLSSEINGRSRRSIGKGRATNGNPKKSKSKKSATTIDSEESGEEGGKKKKRSGGAAKGGFAKEFTLSPPLASLLQVDKLSRPQVVKQLWAYIKGNERQNPSNKREILCDNSLRAVFNVDKIDMFRMNKVLGQHLHESEE